MKRRGFFGALAGIMAAPVAAKAAEAIGQIESKPVVIGEPKIEAATQHPDDRDGYIYATAFSAPIGHYTYYKDD